MTRLQNTKLKLDGCSRCSGCQTVKPVSQFYKDCTRPTGVSSRCKLCESERASLRRAKARAAEQQLLAEELAEIAHRHPSVRELVLWTGVRLAA